MIKDELVELLMKVTTYEDNSASFWFSKNEKYRISMINELPESFLRQAQE